MSNAYTYVDSLHGSVEVPESGILSKPVFHDDRMRVTLFGMSPGEEMTEHTTTMEAVIQVLEGTARITLGDEAFTAGPGTWIQMNPNLRHSITPLEPVKMLLIVLREAKQESAG